MKLRTVTNRFIGRENRYNPKAYQNRTHKISFCKGYEAQNKLLAREGAEQPKLDRWRQNKYAERYYYLTRLSINQTHLEDLISDYRKVC